LDLHHGPKDQIVELADASGNRSGWSYRVWADDSAESYDALGVLLSITTRHGWLTTLTYSTTSTSATVAKKPGLLIRVRNHFGRELNFVYDTRLRISQVLPPGAVAGAAAGSASSPIRYVYDEAASLVSGVTAQGQLTSIVWQDGTLSSQIQAGADAHLSVTSKVRGVSLGSRQGDQEHQYFRLEGEADGLRCRRGFW